MEFLIYLIRHAKTEANLKFLYSGSTDLDLCQQGIDELKEIKQTVEYPKADKYYSSGMLRANQTIELLYENVEYKKLPEFAECNFGDFEMLSYQELKNNPKYITWVEDQTGDLRCPNGESFNLLLERTQRGIDIILEELRAENKQTAVVITHGGVITKLMYTLFPDFAISTELKNVTKNITGYGIKYVDNKAVSFTPVP